MIELKDVQYQYHYDDFAIIKNATFTLSEPICTVAMDVQSGKSTFCRLFTELKYKGSILVDGTELSTISDADRGILYLPSNLAFFEHRSALFNILYPLKVRKTEKSTAKTIAYSLAEKLNITNLLSQKVCKLDVISRKLVALCRGLTISRKIVFFDDFFQSDFPLSPEQIFELFPTAQKIVLTSNCENLFGQVVVMDGGQTVFQGDKNSAKDYISTKLQWLYGKLDK